MRPPAGAVHDEAVVDFAKRRVLVAGAGVTGRSVADALVSLGAEVTVTDADAERLAAAGVAGAEPRPGLTEPPEDTDLVVTSPGWRPDNPLLAAAAARGVEVIGEVELAWRICQVLPDPPAWLAVTGTDGKTTTVSMLESILLAGGADAIACGNVGLPVVDAVRAGHRVLAVELSSFQLHWQSSLRADAAVVLNVAEDHLDWHGPLEAYAEAKGKIYDGAGVRVYNADDEWSARLAAGPGRRVGWTLGEPAPGQFGVRDGWLVDDGGRRLCPVDEVRPPGPHNVANALAAAALALSHGLAPDAIREGLRRFQPVAHRVELVGEGGGIRYVNDSKATNTHAASGSLHAYEHVVWIAGGLLRGALVDGLVADVAGRLRGVVLLGTDQEAFLDALGRHAPDVPVHRVMSRDDGAMMSAVRTAKSLAGPGDVVLLAPAAKSHDMFASYVHRGEAFTAAVRAVLAEGAAGEESGAGTEPERR